MAEGGLGFSSLKRFPKVFWVVISFELMERAAYYGMMGILPVYILATKGLNETQLGLVIGVTMPFLYLMPLFSGALGEKIGYKKQMIFAFCWLTAVYIITPALDDFTSILLMFMALGFGIGSYKPLISAAIGKVVDTDGRNYAFSIYYWVVNLGATITPLVYGFTLSQDEYFIAFYVAGALLAVNIFTCLIFFSEPDTSGQGKTMRDSLGGIKTVISDGSFDILLVILGGFWFMYSMNVVVILPYAMQFGILPDWFQPVHLAVVNPGTIIALGFILAKLVDKSDTLKAMIAGVVIYIIGIVVMGFYPDIYLLVLGIVIMSIGEFIVAPASISYFSKMAPKDKMGIYMGATFLPFLIGLPLGSALGGWMWDVIGTQWHMPRFFWGIIAAIGAVTLATFLMFNRTYGKAFAQRSGEMEKGMAAGEAAAAAGHAEEEAGEGKPGRLPLGLSKRNMWDSNVTVLLSLALVPLLLVSSYSMGTDTYYDITESEGAEEGAAELTAQMERVDKGGTISENAQESIRIEFDNERFTSVKVTLTWTDDPSSYVMGTNEPDQMGFALSAPTGEKLAGAMDASGSVSNDMKAAEGAKNDDYTGEWTLTVECGDCGDDHGPVGFRSTADTSADYQVSVEFQYMGYEKTGK